MKLLIILFTFIPVSCVGLKDLGSTQADKLLAFLIGLKPSDSNYSLSEEPSFIDEGSIKEIKIHLIRQPESDTLVTISSNSKYFELNNSNVISLKFTPDNYSSDQSFTITSLIDNNSVDELGSITINADYGYGTKNLSILHKEGDGAWITVSPDNLFLKNLPGNITVKLNVKPLEDITLALTSKLTLGIENKGSLTFTPSNYSQEQIAFSVSKDILFDTELYHIDDKAYISINSISHTFSTDKKVYINDDKTLIDIYGLFIAIEKDYYDDIIDLDTYEIYVNELIDSDTYQEDYIDKKNNLIWQKCAYDQSSDDCKDGRLSSLSWKNAISYCNSLSRNGFRWRLPTNIELKNHITTMYYIVNKEFLPGALVWSSTTDTSDPLSAKVYDTKNYNSINYLKENNATFYCVADIDSNQLITKEPGYILSQELSVIEEGMPLTLQINLATKPESDVELSISSENEGLIIFDQELIFTPDNYDKPQDIMMLYSDADYINETGQITISANNGYATKIFNVTFKDNGIDSVVLYPNTVFLKDLPEYLYVKMNFDPRDKGMVILAQGEFAQFYGVEKLPQQNLQGIEILGSGDNYNGKYINFISENYPIYQKAFIVNKDILKNKEIYHSNDKSYMTFRLFTISGALEKKIYIDHEQNLSIPDIQDSGDAYTDDANKLYWPYCLHGSYGSNCELGTIDVVSWQDAITQCYNIGARLPTYSELMNHIIHLRFKDRLQQKPVIWSSTTVNNNLQDANGYDSLNMKNINNPKIATGAYYCVNDSGSIIYTSDYEISIDSIVDEGGIQKSGFIKLRTEPSSDVVITITSDNENIFFGSSATGWVNSLSLTFTQANFSIEQGFSVWAGIDEDEVDKISTITISADNGLPDKTLSVTHKDKLAPYIIFDQDGNSLASPLIIDEGSEKLVGFQFLHKPGSDTTLTIYSNNPAIEVNGSSSASLVFTSNNYNETQSISISGLLDNNSADETNISLSITSDNGYPSKTINITHGEATGDWIAITPTSLQLDDLTPVNLQVSLNKKPLENIEITMQIPFTTGITIPGTIIFTPSNYNQPQTALAISKLVLSNPELYHLDDFQNVSITAQAGAFSKTEKIYLSTDNSLESTNLTGGQYNDTYRDINNKLEWMRCIYGSTYNDVNNTCISGQTATWQAAINTCTNITTAGNKWRLPTIQELGTHIYSLLNEPVLPAPIYDNGIWTLNSNWDEKNKAYYYIVNSNGSYTYTYNSKTLAGTFYCVKDL